MIRKAIANFSEWGQKRLYSSSVIATIEGIPIASFRDDSSNFLRVITRSFDLLRGYDPKRLKRISSCTDWIVDCSLPLGAFAGQFCPRLSAIEMDFEFSTSFGDELRHAAYFAAVMVHEGTHGMLLKRGFEYTSESRVQIERICVAEEHRFLARLDSIRESLGSSLKEDFDAENWEEVWTMGKWETVKRLVTRTLGEGKSEQIGGGQAATRSDSI